MALEIRSFELPPIGTQCYLVLNPESRRIAVFDAPYQAFATSSGILEETGFQLEGLYFTHGHWDHTLDGARFNEAGFPASAHPGDKRFYEDPASMAAFSIPGMEMPPVRIDNWLDHNEGITILGHPVQVRHIPGHSPGSILYWFSDDNFAITGDALFRGSIGRTDFPGCSLEQLAASIRDNIYSLPGETRIYPGHGPSTTVKYEAVNNPFVSL